MLPPATMDAADGGTTQPFIVTPAQAGIHVISSWQDAVSRFRRNDEDDGNDRSQSWWAATPALVLATTAWVF